LPWFNRQRVPHSLPPFSSPFSQLELPIRAPFLWFTLPSFLPPFVPQTSAISRQRTQGLRFSLFFFCFSTPASVPQGISYILFYSMNTPWTFFALFSLSSFFPFHYPLCPSSFLAILLLYLLFTNSSLCPPFCFDLLYSYQRALTVLPLFPPSWFAFFLLLLHKFTPPPLPLCNFWLIAYFFLLGAFFCWCFSFSFSPFSKFKNIAVVFFFFFSLLCASWPIFFQVRLPSSNCFAVLLSFLIGVIFSLFFCVSPPPCLFLALLALSSPPVF